MSRTETDRLVQDFNVSRETFARLATYEKLLLKWQTKINLVSPDTLPHIWHRHFADSARLLHEAPHARTWADLGSGAGFPGLVIAIMSHVAQTEVHLIESDQRKAAFLREVSRETSAPVIIHNARIQDVVSGLHNIDAVTARALAPLPALIQMATPLLKAGATGLFPKGRNVRTELHNWDKPTSLEIEERISSSQDGSGTIVRARWSV